MCDSYDVGGEKLFDLKGTTISIKQATVASVFLLYLVFIVALGIKYIMKFKKRVADQESFNQFTNDIIYRSFFFFFLALVMSIQVATPFGAVICYLYLLAFPFILLGQLKENLKIKLVGHLIQIVATFVMFLYILINPWCRYYYFRYSGSSA